MDDHQSNLNFLKSVVKKNEFGTITYLNVTETKILLLIINIGYKIRFYSKNVGMQESGEYSDPAFYCSLTRILFTVKTIQKIHK